MIKFENDDWDSFTESVKKLIPEVENTWSKIDNDGKTFFTTLEVVLKKVVKADESEIYRMNTHNDDVLSSLDDDYIFMEHYFFYNKVLKLVVGFKFGLFRNEIPVDDDGDGEDNRVSSPEF